MITAIFIAATISRSGSGGLHIVATSTGYYVFDNTSSASGSCGTSSYYHIIPSLSATATTSITSIYIIGNVTINSTFIFVAQFLLILL